MIYHDEKKASTVQTNLDNFFFYKKPTLILNVPTVYKDSELDE